MSEKLRTLQLVPSTYECGQEAPVLSGSDTVVHKIAVTDGISRLAQQVQLLLSTATAAHKNTVMV